MKNKGMILGLGILLMCTMTACTDQTIPAVETPAATAPAAETAGAETTTEPTETDTPEETDVAEPEATTTKTPDTSAEESPDASIEGGEISGKIRSFTGGYLTIITDEEDSRILEFNLSEAQLECENGILAGDAVTVVFEGTIDGNSTRKATATKVIDPAGKDKLEQQFMIAAISDVSTNMLTVTNTEGDSYSFVTTGAAYNCSNGLEPGNWVILTYLGELKISTAKNIKVLSVTDAGDEITAAQEETLVTALSKKISTLDRAKIYDNYTVDSEVIAVLPAETQLNQTGETDIGWVRIDYEGSDAYIFKSHLNTIPPSNSASSPSLVENEIDPEETLMRACITSVDRNLITVKSEEDGDTYVFDCGKASLEMSYGPLEGSEINIAYAGKASRNAEDSQVISITDVDPDVVNEETGGFSVTGTVMAFGPNNITVMSNDGAQITCTTEALSESTDYEFSEGDYVTIIIKPNSTSNVHEALEINKVY